VLGRGLDVARALLGDPRDPLVELDRRRALGVGEPDLEHVDQPGLVLVVLVESLERRRRRGVARIDVEQLAVDPHRLAGVVVVVARELGRVAQRLDLALRVALMLGAALERGDQRLPVVAPLAQVLEDLDRGGGLRVDLDDLLVRRDPGVGLAEEAELDVAAPRVEIAEPVGARRAALDVLDRAVVELHHRRPALGLVADALHRGEHVAVGRIGGERRRVVRDRALDLSALGAQRRHPRQQRSARGTGLGLGAGLEQPRQLAIAAELLVELLERGARGRLVGAALEDALVRGRGVGRAVEPAGAQIGELEQDRDLALDVRGADRRHLALERGGELAPAAGVAQQAEQVALARVVVQRLLGEREHPDRGVDVAELVLVELGELGGALRLVDVGRRGLELAAPDLGELGPLGDLGERLGEDLEVARRLRRAAECAGELVPQAERAGGALDADQRLGLIGLDAEHVEIGGDHGLGLAVELDQQLCEVALQLHAARERRFAGELAAHDLERAVEPAGLVVQPGLLAQRVGMAGLAGANQRGERGVAIAAVLPAARDVDPDLGAAGGRADQLGGAPAQLERAVPQLVAIAQPCEREHGLGIVGVLVEHAVERGARAGQVAELLEQDDVLADRGGARVSAGERAGQLGQHRGEPVVAPAGPVHRGERGAAEHVAGVEIGSVAQRVLGLDEVAARQLDDAARTPQRAGGARIGLGDCPREVGARQRVVAAARSPREVVVGRRQCVARRGGALPQRDRALGIDSLGQRRGPAQREAAARLEPRDRRRVGELWRGELDDVEPAHRGRRAGGVGDRVGQVTE
jgi:hypothetical protein